MFTFYIYRNYLNTLCCRFEKIKEQLLQHFKKNGCLRRAFSLQSFSLSFLPHLAPPFVASTPNFYLGDPLLSRAFNLSPKKEEHATFVDIEPVCITISHSNFIIREDNL